MVRKWCCALMIPLLLLAGCGGGRGGDEAEQLALEIRAEYLSMAGCTAQLAVTADYGDRVFACVLALDHTVGAETALTVVEPELLKGVTARFRTGSTLLEFDGASLETGALTPEGLSPLECVPFLLKEIQEGFISQWGLETLGETECVRFTTSDPALKMGQGTETSLWFDREDYALKQGEITVEGVSVLRCTVTDFTWKEKED